ncbi:MAG: hypothetical protein HYW71_01510 [Candidatus Niyogibacteria bacterium]|nr:hypothetical protein [Candidatus Niyogibacteria bacterium]
MKKLLIIGIAVIVSGGAFYGGMKYAENKALSDRQQRIQQFGGSRTEFRNGGSGNRIGGGFASGEIIAKDNKSLTVKLQDGGSKIIFLSDSTEITKSAEGALSDLEIGKNISVNGAANSDGSVTAQIIQLKQLAK